MFTWLRARPLGSRRAARPASPAAAPVVPAFPEPMVSDASQSHRDADDELPPPFFADPDPAFLDLNDGPATTDRVRSPDVLNPESSIPQFPPPLPVPAEKLSALAAQDRLARALAELPPYPSADDPDRFQTLLEIYRALDRIAGDVCNDLDSTQQEAGSLPEPALAR
jgi:hypothetical protein